MTRTSKHNLKFSNTHKLNLLNNVFKDYQNLLQYYVDLILNQTLPIKRNLTTTVLPNYRNIAHSAWKQIAYKQASEIVRSNLTKTENKVYKRYQFLYSTCIKNNKLKYFTDKRFKELNINFIKRLPKIQIKNISIPIDQRLTNSKRGKTFDQFVLIRSPYFQQYKKRSIVLKVPLKYHRQSNKLKNNSWTRKKTIMLRKKNDEFYLDLIWEKDEKTKTKVTKSIGIDVGYKKLISSSSGSHYGKELFGVYNKLSTKKQGSKNFKQTLKQRDELINFYVKEFINTEQPDEVIVEKLKNLKYKTKGKIYNKIMNKMQRWSYRKTFYRLSLLAEEEGFFIKQVDAAYTSQTCSKCGNICKKSRNGEIYKCVKCKMIKDADSNAALNILHRGAIYGPSTT